MSVEALAASVEALVMAARALAKSTQKIPIPLSALHGNL